MGNPPAATPSFVILPGPISDEWRVKWTDSDR